MTENEVSRVQSLEERSYNKVMEFLPWLLQILSKLKK